VSREEVLAECVISLADFLRPDRHTLTFSIPLYPCGEINGNNMERERGREEEKERERKRKKEGGRERKRKRGRERGRRQIFFPLLFV
jgi:hypothetical protein